MIDIKMPILEKDHEWKIHASKLKEECEELVSVINIVDKREINLTEEIAAEILSETLDVLQMCIGIIDKLIKAYPSIIASGVIKHVEKLYTKGWKF